MSAIEERIRKLLALADSPNENEAAAAAEKAQALMLRYGIEMATIAASGGERLAVDEHVLDGKVDPWRRMLASAVACSAGGRVVWAPDGDRRGQGTIFFYGPAGAVGAMIELYRYLEAQLVVISATATAARRERRVHGRTWRSSFLLGAVGRVGQRLDARRAEVAEAERTAVRLCWSRRLLTARSSGAGRSWRPRAIGRRLPAARMRQAARRASTSILATGGSGAGRRRCPTPRRDERRAPVAGGVVPVVSRAGWVALSDEPLRRQAFAGAARRTGVAPSLVPVLQGAARVTRRQRRVAGS